MNYSRPSWNFGGYGYGNSTPIGVKSLLVVNIMMYLIKSATMIGTSFSQNPIVSFLGLTPNKFWGGMFWQPFTYLFLHGGLFHLLFNMLILWMFGKVLENIWGTKKFLQYYFITGIGPALLNCILTPSSPVPIIGASGAMYGLLTAYGLMFPNNLIYLYFLMPIKVKYLVILFGLFEFINSIRIFAGASSSIAHYVHLGGMIFGLVYMKWGDFIRMSARKVKTIQREKERKVWESRIIAEEKLQQEVDDLLDKINEVGMENLTAWEKKRLEEASEMLRQKNDKRHH